MKRDYTLYLVVFVILIAMLAACSSKTKCTCKHEADGDYQLDFLNGAILKVYPLPKNMCVIALLVITK